MAVADGLNAPFFSKLVLSVFNFDVVVFLRPAEKRKDLTQFRYRTYGS